MNIMPLDKLLIVDDNSANIDLLVDTLYREFDLSIATSGKQALTIVSVDIPDLILLDIMMPGMDGYEVCRKLKAGENTANIPIIFVSAKSEVEDEQKGFELGAADYITKPFSPPIVKARVKNHILIKRQREQLEQSVTSLKHEKDLLQQKAEIGIQAGGLAHDMANVFTTAQLLNLIPRQQPESLSDWQLILEDVDTVIESIKMGVEICHDFNNYFRDIGEEDRIHSFKEFLPSLKIYARQFKGNLVQEIDEQIPPIKCKGYQLKRVLINLLVNAMQAVGNQSNAKIIIKLWSQSDKILFSIKDNGAGISPKILPHIFKECFTTKKEGTGLGLFLTKQIIDAHGGGIELLSEENKGAEFILSFPAYKDC